MTRRITVLLLALFTVTLAAQQAPDRTAPPEPGPTPALRLPAVQHLRLANGVPVWIVELHDVPIVQVNVVVFTGSSADPVGKFGAANMTVGMLDEGAGTRSSLEIADVVDFLGADLEPSSGIDASTVRLHVPVARLAEALPVMADVVLRPTFPARDLERIREDRLTTILQSRDDPGAIGALAFARVLFGATHRFGTAAIGTAHTVTAFSADDLRGFYRAAFQPRNAALVVVGDVTPAQVMPLLDANFGRWADGPTAPPAVDLPAVSQPARRQVVIVDTPDAAQSQIRIGWIGVPRSTPDYFPIEVLNTILGGSFSSRLNTNLRETHGYAYGASSGFDMRRAAGPFVAAASIQTDKTGEALVEFFKELNAIREPVPAEELARAKNYVALRYPSRFETTGAISRHLEDALVYQLPDDYFANYVARINAVTAADVQRVARAYIQPDRFVVVITGDRKKIEAAVRAAELGPIQFLTVDEVFQ